MSNECLPADEILKCFGEIGTMRLEDVLDPNDTEDDINIFRPSLYYSTDNFPSYLKEPGKINVLSLNAQSINSKFDSILVLLEYAKVQNIYFHVIRIQETWLNDNSDLSLFNIDGYNCYFQGTRCSRHGGLITYVDSQLNSSVLNIDIKSEIWEGLFVSIVDNITGKETVLGNIYRPPYDNNNEQNINTFVAELDPIIGLINDCNRELVIAGDYNINLLHVNHCNKEHFGNFLDMLLGYSLIPKITFPTRLGENSCSLIDNIFCSLSPSNLASQAGIIHTGISDHFPYFVSLCSPISKNINKPSRYVKHRIKSQEAYNGLLTDLMNSDLISFLDRSPYGDPNRNYNMLHNRVKELKEKHLPYKFVKFNKHRHENSSWITQGVIKSIRYRDKLYRELKSSDRSSPRHFQLKNTLSIYNKLLKKTIREAKTIYYNQRFEENRTNIKNTWVTINEIICKKKNKGNGIKAIMKDGQIIQDKKSVVNSFNDFFVNIGKNLTQNITKYHQKSFQMYLNNNILCSFGFKLIDDDYTKKVINSLRTKTSSGHDGISVKLLKFLSPGLAGPLTIIINQSLITGIFPDKLKIAKVVPLHKKDDKMKLDNYRPISLLSSISKVFEKVVFNQLTEYFKLNNLLFEGQYGFRDKHSTELATVELMDRVITALEEKRLPISIFMDLSKAFDTLDHKILLSKLQYYGVTGTALNWFNDYLSNRSQYVEINGMSSDVKNIDTGVPQGSILGPLLFLIYMNDIPNVSKIFKFILYADDTTLFSTIEFSVPIERSNVNQMLNNELSLVCEWLNINKLSLNINKTKFMVFHPYQKEVLHLTPCLKIADTVIENVNEFNFLGVHLDSHMTWKSHTDKLALKLSKYTGILNKLKHYLPSYILRTLYFTLIHSHLNYAILTWGYKCNRLNKLQKRLIRVVTSSKYNAHTDPLFKITQILKLQDLLNLNALKFYYRYLHETLPSFFYCFGIATQGAHHSHDTRQRDQIRTHRSRTDYCENRLRVYLPKLINSTPLDLLQKITTHSIQGFSSGIKNHFLCKYDDSCSLTNCYICRHNGQW